MIAVSRAATELGPGIDFRSLAPTFDEKTITQIMVAAAEIERTGVVTNELAQQLDELAKTTGDEKLREMADQALGMALAAETAQKKLDAAKGAIEGIAEQAGRAAPELRKVIEALADIELAVDLLAEAERFEPLELMSIEGAERQLAALRLVGRVTKENEEAQKKADAEAKRAGETRAKAIQDVTVQQRQLESLGKAYGVNAKAVRDAEVAIDAENKARQAGIAVGSKEYQIILRATDAIRTQIDANKASEEAIKDADREKRAAGTGN